MQSPTLQMSAWSGHAIQNTCPTVNPLPAILFPLAMVRLSTDLPFFMDVAATSRLWVPWRQPHANQCQAVTTPCGLQRASPDTRHSLHCYAYHVCDVHSVYAFHDVYAQKVLIKTKWIFHEYIPLPPIPPPPCSLVLLWWMQLRTFLWGNLIQCVLIMLISQRLIPWWSKMATKFWHCVQQWPTVCGAMVWCWNKTQLDKNSDFVHLFGKVNTV